MIKFHTPTWVATRIEKVEVIKETAKFVVLQYPNGGREHRESKENYHDSWDKAHEHLLGIARRKVEVTENRLTIYEKDLEEIQNMTEIT